MNAPHHRAAANRPNLKERRGRRLRVHVVVMLLPLIGGPRDGDMVNCCCEPKCDCQTFGHGAPNGNKIMDGYVEFLMYRRTESGWVPDRIERKTMCSGRGLCPRCNRAMPENIVYCKNCGAEMDPLGSEMSA